MYSIWYMRYDANYTCKSARERVKKKSPKEKNTRFAWIMLKYIRKTHTHTHMVIGYNKLLISLVNAQIYYPIKRNEKNRRHNAIKNKNRNNRLYWLGCFSGGTSHISYFGYIFILLVCHTYEVKVALLMFELRWSQLY